MRYENKSDGELIEIIIHGDLSAYEILICRYEKLIYNLAFVKLRNRKAAMDISTECFIETYKKLLSCRFKDSFLSTIYRKCSELIHSYSKNDAECGDDSACLCNTEEIPTDMEQAEIIRRAVLSLPEEYREIIVMWDICGLKYSQIARMIRLDEKMVKNNAAYARAGLKHFLSPDTLSR